jgi:hypothetical protein
MIYDVIIVTVGSISIVGAVWAGYLTHKHRREVRIYKQVKLETGYEVPKWLLRVYESTFRPSSKSTPRGQ